MITIRKTCLLLVATLWAAPFVRSDTMLHDFSAFASPATTVFVGDWALNGDPISGDSNPIVSFSQDVGVYHFMGGTNADTAGAYYFPSAGPWDLTGHGLLQLSARLFDGTTATSFAVSLLNFATNESAVAIFETADFTGSGFTTVAATLTPSGLFDFSSVDAFLIGGVPGGTGTLNLAVDTLAAANPGSGTPVPDSSIPGLFAGVFLTTIALARRIRGSCRRA